MPDPRPAAGPAGRPEPRSIDNSLITRVRATLAARTRSQVRPSPRRGTSHIRPPQRG